MLKSTKLLPILAIVLFSGCDVPGVIKLENRSDTVAYYNYYEKNHNGQIDTINIEIASLKGSNEELLLFGFGQYWTDNRIKEYVDSIISIEMIASGDTIMLTNKNDMYNYFRERRKGLLKQTVRITLK